MISLDYRIVDVLTTEPMAGNPLAVFIDDSAIDEALMQKIACEMNLAETTFVLPSDNPGCTGFSQQSGTNGAVRPGRRQLRRENP